MPVVKITMKGPLFDGRADAAVQEWLKATKKTLLDQAAAIIRTKRMNRSGRGGTGEAVAGLRLTYEPTYMVSGGIEEGKFSWPWLEGVSQRNQSTPFRGYHIFRTAGRVTRKRAKAEAEEMLQQYIPDMGGK